MSATVPPEAKTVRLDIQGLRALAVALVVVFHIWPSALTGGFIGVDVFFVLSGYLITSHLLASRPAKAADLALFWMRRIRRLLPAALLVLTVTLVASRLLAPATQWKDTALGALSAAFYVENWRLAGQAVDYLAAENAASPVQHYWSLSVEEQFYLFWPVLILICGVVAIKLRLPLRVVAGVSIGAVVLASFAYSVMATAADPASAYFVTPTRIWELGVGGAVAVIGTARTWGGPTDTATSRALSSMKTPLAWAGIAAIVWSAFTYDSGTPFPGSAAAVPVLATALVVWLHADGRWSPTAVSAWRPVHRLGDISYSTYLWHWPLIVLLTYVSGSRGALDSAAIIIATLVLASLTKTHVEDRFRRHNPRLGLARPFLAAGLGSVLVASLALAQTGEVEVRQATAREQVRAALAGEDPCFGAGAMDPSNDCVQEERQQILPDPAQAPDDVADAYEDDCWVYRPFDEFKTCQYGASDPDAKVALVGNSHAGHWLPAIQSVAEDENWQVTTLLASQCFPTTARLDLETEEFKDNCLKWGEKVQDAAGGDEFDLVVVSTRTGLNPVGASSDEEAERAWRDGYREYVDDWVADGTDVLVIRDTPFPANTVSNVPDCVAANADELEACSGSRDEWMNPDPLADVVRDDGRSSTEVVDLTDHFCDETCEPVIGGALAYFDSSHITATFAETLAPYLRPSLVEAVAEDSEEP